MGWLISIGDLAERLDGPYESSFIKFPNTGDIGVSAWAGDSYRSFGESCGSRSLGEGLVF